MKIAVMSDLHMEFSAFDLSVRDEPADVLVLAGDICNMTKRSSFTGFFQQACSLFDTVLYVPGNHEAYGGSIDTCVSKFHMLLELDVQEFGGDVSNLTVLNDTKFVVDDVTFLGGTLWTGFSSPIDENTARFGMYDYQAIRTGGTGYDYRLAPRDTHRRYINTMRFLRDNMPNNGKTVVVTHHAPSYFSMPENFRGDPLNICYYNNLDMDIRDWKPEVWLHGHSHQAVDYDRFDTRVVCNPRGYVTRSEVQKTGFDINKTIEV